ncbi:MAG: tRNA (adenosine(37)-N6)-threonylcarbamoyltransferase complex ATPase subunit type 1 TsaE [Candidatus Moraniibacteriota bacterium]
MSKDLKEIITNNSRETFDCGKDFARKLKGGELLCLEGELGAGKTTFAQGLLAGLGVKETVNSPTFLVMKQYLLENNKGSIKKIYHIDAYRINGREMSDLGWEELLADKDNLLIVEWPEKIREIIPADFWQIDFEHLEGEQRKISFKKYAEN